MSNSSNAAVQSEDVPHTQEVVAVTACWGPGEAHAQLHHLHILYPGHPRPCRSRGGCRRRHHSDAGRPAGQRGLPLCKICSRNVAKTHLASNCPRYMPGWSKVIKINECHGGGGFTGQRKSTVTQGARISVIAAVCQRWSSTSFEFFRLFLLLLLHVMEKVPSGCFFQWGHIPVPIWENQMTKLNWSETQTSIIYITMLGWNHLIWLKRVIFWRSLINPLHLKVSRRMCIHRNFMFHFNYFSAAEVCGRFFFIQMTPPTGAFTRWLTRAGAVLFSVAPGYNSADWQPGVGSVKACNFLSHPLLSSLMGWGLFFLGKYSWFSGFSHQKAIQHSWQPRK